MKKPCDSLLILVESLASQGPVEACRQSLCKSRPPVLRILSIVASTARISNPLAAGYSEGPLRPLLRETSHVLPLFRIAGPPLSSLIPNAQWVLLYKRDIRSTLHDFIIAMSEEMF